MTCDMAILKRSRVIQEITVSVLSVVVSECLFVYVPEQMKGSTAT